MLALFFLGAFLLVAGCGGGGGQEEQEEDAPPVAGTFVGEAQDEDAFVAIVAASPEEEAED